MKREIFACVTSAVLFAATLSVLTACGGAKGIKGQEITLGQWDAAFELLEEYENCDRITIDFSRKQEFKGKLDTSAVGGKEMTGVLKISEKMKAVKCLDRQYVETNDALEFSEDWKFVFAEDIEGIDLGKDPNQKRTDKIYAEKVDGSTYKVYTVDKEKSEWQSHESKQGIVPSVYDLVESDVDVFDFYLTDFDSYEYSAKEGGYVLKKSVLPEEIESLVIKFNSGGLLSGIYYKYVKSTYKVQTDSYPVYSREDIQTVIGDMTISYDAKEIKMP